MRHFHSFTWKEGNFRICSQRSELIIAEIKTQRQLLGEYIERSPEFLMSLGTIKLLDDAPEIAQRMHQASLLTEAGPMAAVAGTVAHMAAEAALRAPINEAGRPIEALVENGGDMYLSSPEEVVVALYAGESSLSGKLALRVKPEQMPLAICSSSSTMGHSLSFGNCDLATVVARSGALADAAATMSCNMVKTAEDINPTLEKTLRIPGVLGVLLIKGDAIGFAGELPELIKHDDPAVKDKVTRAPGVLIE